MTSPTLSDTELIRERVSATERKDDAVYITLTRTATLSITTAGTIITWQEEVDSCGKITYSGSTITVPVAGYYYLCLLGTLGVKDDCYGEVVVGGTTVCTMGTAASKDEKFRLAVTRFFKKGDAVQIRLSTKTGTMTLQVNQEDIASESPIFHMVLI